MELMPLDYTLKVVSFRVCIFYHNKKIINAIKDDFIPYFIDEGHKVQISRNLLRVALGRGKIRICTQSEFNLMFVFFQDIYWGNVLIALSCGNSLSA